MKPIIINNSPKQKARSLALRTVKLLSFLVLFSNVSMAQNSINVPTLAFQPIPLAGASDTLPNQSLSSGERRDLENSIEDYQDAISSLKGSNGSNDELIAQLGPLGVAFQTLDRHDEAITSLREAISLIQGNGSAQIPLQEQLALSYLANNDIDSVDDIEDLIYSLYQDNFSADSQELFFATVSLADWNLAAYYRENYGSRGMNVQRNVVPQTMRQGGGSGGDATTDAIFSGNIKELNNSDITDIRIRRITRLYEDYQEALFATGNVQLAIIQEIAKRTASIAFIAKQERDFERDANVNIPNYAGSRVQAARNSSERLDESYESGRDALIYLLTTLESVQGIQKEMIAMAQLDLADWYLTYGKVQAAQEAYAQATQSLIDAGFSSENIDLALATAMPIQIPIFATHLYTRGSAGVRSGQNLDFQGYVDVSFDVNDIGNASKVKVINNSNDEHLSALERLIEVQFRSMKFRPTLKDGELVSPGTTNLRYYYAY